MPDTAHRGTDQFVLDQHALAMLGDLPALPAFFSSIWGRALAAWAIRVKPWENRDFTRSTAAHQKVITLSAASVACAVEAPVGAAPAVETMRLSSAFDPVIQPGVTVDVAGSEIIFTARDEQGRPLAGARITLNGGAQRVADSAGRVSFPVVRGRHVLLIEADGYPASEVVVVV